MSMARISVEARMPFLCTDDGSEGPFGFLSLEFSDSAANAFRFKPLVRLTLLFPALSAYCLQVFIKARVMTNMIGDTDED